ncbi:MAG: rod shape-determining protein MreC [Saprospiraceae bacterium]
MLNALRIIIKNGSVVLFIVLQIICFYLIVKYNQKQNQIYFYSTQVYSNNFYSKYKSLVSYFNLKSENERIITENALLLKKYYTTCSRKNIDTLLIDSIRFKYQIIPADVVNNSVSKRNNTITLDKGIKDGISVGMGVISDKGLLGIVTDVSEHFSLVMSILHSKSRISCLLPHCGFFGTLVWDGVDPNVLHLEDIQKYAEVRKGDSVVTSGYSIVFPENILVGRVIDLTVESGAFTYTIQVEPNQSFFKLTHVYVINHQYKEEKEWLEKKAEIYE